MFALVGESRTRGYSLKIKGHSFRKEMRRILFIQRVVELFATDSGRGQVIGSF